LRSGVTFQDGTPFNAAAVKFTLDRAQNDAASTVKSVLFMLGSTVVVDDMTVDCMLSQNAPQPLLFQLADRPGMIVSPTAVGKVNGNSVSFSNAPIGAGMYKVSGAWYPREKMSVRAWDGYWDKASQTLGGIDFTNVLEAARVNALRAGSQDLCSGLIASDYNALKGTNITTKIGAATMIYGLNMNITIKPMDNMLVRQAIACAIDRVAVNNALAQGLGQPVYQIASPVSPAYDPSLDSINKFDLTRSKQLLTQAGFPNGLTFQSIIGSTAAIFVQFGELLQSQLKQAGINMDLQLVNQALTVPMLYRTGGHGNVASAPIGGGIGVVGLDNILRNALTPAGTTNAGGVDVPGVKALLDQAASATNQADATTAYKAVNKICTQGAYWFIPVYAAPVITGYGNYLGGPVTAEGDSPLTTQFLRSFYITKGKVKAA
jgi:peptide/nickel transport system substrate-binding protein